MATTKDVPLTLALETTPTTVVPLSAAGADGKGKRFEIRDDSGTMLLRVDASTLAVTFGSSVVIGSSGSAVNFTGIPKIPVLTGAQRTALTPVDGMFIFNSDTAEFQVYFDGGWAKAAMQ